MFVISWQSVKDKLSRNANIFMSFCDEIENMSLCLDNVNFETLHIPLYKIYFFRNGWISIILHISQPRVFAFFISLGWTELHNAKCNPW